MKNLIYLFTLALTAITTAQASDYPYAADPVEFQIIYASDINKEINQLPHPTDIRELERIFTETTNIITTAGSVLNAKAKYFLSDAFKAIQEQPDDMSRIGMRYIQAINALRANLHDVSSLDMLHFLATEARTDLDETTKLQVTQIFKDLMAIQSVQERFRPVAQEKIKSLIQYAKGDATAKPQQAAAAASAQPAAVHPAHAPQQTHPFSPKKRKSADLSVIAELPTAVDAQRKSPRKQNRSVTFNPETTVATYTRSRQSYDAMHGESPKQIFYATKADIQGGFSTDSRIGTPFTSPLKGADDLGK